MIRFLTISFIFLLMISCADDSLGDANVAERYYVDLFYALHHDDQPGAKEAARQFSRSISGFFPEPYSWRSEEAVEDTRFFVNKAEQNYLQVRASIANNELELAMIQLDRATEALKAARIPGLGDLYVAGIHDFLISWTEVSRMSRKEGLGDRDWRAIGHQIKTANDYWRQSKGLRPSPTVYFFPEADLLEFEAAHRQVDRLMGELRASLEKEDAVLTKSYVDATDSAVWSLIRRFGSPREVGIETSPPETDLSR